MLENQDYSSAQQSLWDNIYFNFRTSQELEH